MVFPGEQMFECRDGDQFKNIGTNEMFILFQPSQARWIVIHRKDYKIHRDDYTRDKYENLISFSLTVDC